MKYANSNDVNNYDVVIVSNNDDLKILSKSIRYIIKNLSPNNIIIISPNDTNNLQITCDTCNIIHINEDEVFPGMTLAIIKNIMCEISGSNKRAGWYFQQFLKMSYALMCHDNYYLIWDADTLPLNHISFINNSDKLLFTMKTEYHKPYFDTINNLFGYHKAINKSFIAEHMIIDKNIMRELINDIEKNTKLIGKSFYEKIMRAIDMDEIQGSGFSEFETYGTYVLNNYRNRYQLRELRTCRNAKIILGEIPNEELLDWAKKSYDIISLENSMISLPFLTNVTHKRRIRRVFSMKFLNYFGTINLFFMVKFGKLIKK